MVKSFFICGECNREYPTKLAAIRCEISYHGTETRRVADDQFYTTAQVAAMTAQKVTRIAMWLSRYGRVFEHMIDRKSQTDYQWCVENGRPDLVARKLKPGRPRRYLIPARDVDALRKAIRLFDTGRGFDTGTLGAIVVHSETGGKFRVPK